LPDSLVSTPGDDHPLHVTVNDRGPYTTTFTLTYRFQTEAGEIVDPDLQVRTYGDAGLAEALSCARWHRHPVLAQWHRSGQSRDANVDLEARWRRNMMLNKWLDYCIERGHVFKLD
jgi:uncharacterized protein